MNDPAPRVLQVVLNLDPGGTERLVIELVKRLRHRMPIAVCCLDVPGQWAHELTDAGVDVFALGREPGFQRRVVSRLRAEAVRRGTTVLHCHHYSPFVYGRLASLGLAHVRTVFTEHGRLSDAPPSAKRRLVNHLLPVGVTDLFAVSHDLRRHLIAEGLPARMRVVWNGIDPGCLPGPAERAAARALLGAAEDDVVVGSVGRLNAVKDFGTLVAAFDAARTRMPRLRLVIVGDGPERSTLSDAVAAAGLEGAVTLAGHRSDVRALLPGMDVYANSSVTEGISLTLLEAMATGRPVVATRVGGTPEVVCDGETGVLCAARQPPALADGLTALAADPVRAAQYGAAGRQRVLEHFTIDRMVDRYAAVYEGTDATLSAPAEPGGPERNP